MVKRMRSLKDSASGSATERMNVECSVERQDQPEQNFRLIFASSFGNGKLIRLGGETEISLTEPLVLAESLRGQFVN